jgi:hypothetical protein
MRLKSSRGTISHYEKMRMKAILRKDNRLQQLEISPCKSLIMLSGLR